MLQEPLLPRLAHTGDTVQLRALGGTGVLLVVVGDGEAVDLLLHRADKGKQGGCLLYAQLMAPGGDERTGAVAVVLDHAQHGHIQPGLCQHLLGHTGVLLTAVDQQQVRQRGELFIAVQIVPEPAGEHLIHGRIVVRPLHIL